MVLLARLNRTCGSKLYHLASVFSSELPLRHVRRADLVALGKISCRDGRAACREADRRRRARRVVARRLQQMKFSRADSYRTRPV